jgi:hypothetical protein
LLEVRANLFVGRLINVDAPSVANVYWPVTGKWGRNRKENAIDLVAEYCGPEKQEIPKATLPPWEQPGRELDDKKEEKEPIHLTEIAAHLYHVYKLSVDDYPWFAIDANGDTCAYTREPRVEENGDEWLASQPGADLYFLDCLDEETMAALPPWTDTLLVMRPEPPLA